MIARIDDNVVFPYQFARRVFGKFAKPIIYIGDSSLDIGNGYDGMAVDGPFVGIQGSGKELFGFIRFYGSYKCRGHRNHWLQEHNVLFGVATLFVSQADHTDHCMFFILDGNT